MRFCVYNNTTYIVTGHMMSDIYGFGVLLIEILTALPAIGENTPDEHYSLVEWASQILANKRNLKDIIDPRLEQNYPLESAFECGALAIKCVANKRNDRPSSKDVLQVLERIYAVSLIWKDADKT
ncbi:putative transferase [Helianthus debilis subsp. tardiflorus]